MQLMPWRPVQAAPDTKPNIILVMPDDVGYGDYSSLGAPIMHTTAVDAFKKQSLLFTQFHVSPTCSPTRAAILSGRHEFKNGVTHTIFERERMSLKTITLPQVLKSAGYTTWQRVCQFGAAQPSTIISQYDNPHSPSPPCCHAAHAMAARPSST